MPRAVRSALAGTSVTYDAFGRAVQTYNGSAYTQIVYAPNGTKFAFMNGASVKKYIAPLAAGLQAVYTANGAAPLYWRHADWLGSSRLASKVDHSVYYDGAYAPFGEPYAQTGTTDLSFTGQTQDTASGYYDFLMRQQSPSQGRWMVPDPAGRAAVDITNPQTWNRYAYVGNNPLNYIDPLGLSCEDPHDGTPCVVQVTAPDPGGWSYLACTRLAGTGKHSVVLLHVFWEVWQQRQFIG